ncbi:MAG: NYN domain-containing protein [Acidimicrobiales bacterium]
MADTARVAVYLDFDNVVISRYDNVHGSGSWRRDDAWTHDGAESSADPVDAKLRLATVDLGAIIDYASGFGTVALTRAYADWSTPANAAYRRQLIDRAVDLVQLFANAGTKNGADIRLAVDAVDDLFQHDDISHVLVVAGDSDYVPLAQRCKRMGRYVVGIGVAGSTSTALVAACDEFTDYARLPGIQLPTTPAPSRRKAAATAVTEKATATKKATTKTTTRVAAKTSEPPEQAAATSLLLRAMRVGAQKSDDEWIHMSSVKSQMQRMDPSFKEKSVGYASFRDFVQSRADQLDFKQLDNGQTLVKLI